MKPTFSQSLSGILLSICALTALFPCPAFPATNCLPSPSGLVGWWRAEGNTADSAGLNNGSTPFGIAYSAGMVGQAFSFNATERRVSIPDSPAFKLTKSLTIEGWIKVAGDGGFILFRGDNRSALDPYALTMGSAGHLSFHVESLDSSVNLEAPIDFNNWRHVAATLDDASGIMRIYVDGALAAEQWTPLRPFGDLDPTLEPAIGIGNSGGTFFNFAFNGLIDEISLYSRALDQSEIQVLFNTGSVGKCFTNCTPPPPGIVSTWVAESNASDSAGHNSGILSNGVQFGQGVVHQAFYFNGSNSFVEIPDSADLRITNVLSIEFWVKRLRLEPPSLPYAEYILEKGGDWTAGTQNYAVALHNSSYSNCLHFLFANGWRGAGSIADTNWHHCAIVATNGAVDPAFYIDGVSQPVTFGDGAPVINLYPSTRPLHIGAQVDPQSGWFYFGNTLVDELTIYNQGLSAADVQAIYNANAAGKCITQNLLCVTAPPGLISWWPGQGHVLDVVGRNNGTLWGNATFGPGEVGLGLVLDGNHDAIQVGSATNLQLQDFSIETWIRRSSATLASFDPGGGVIFGFGSLGPGLGMYDDGSLYLTRIDIDNVSLAPGVTDTNFHHVAVTKSGTNVVFYVDGVPHLMPPYDPGFSFLSPAAIGARGDTLGNSFLGTIDELAFYNRSLSADEVISIYYAGIQGKCRSLVPPSIITQPHGKTVWVGDSATFGVTATGDAPLGFQWRFGGADLPGQTGPSLVLVNVDSTNAGDYSVSITNAAGSVISSNATLIVNPQPPCIPAPSGLVSWWPGQTNAQDALGLNNGNLVGNGGYGPARVGQGFVFDGQNGSVLLGTAPTLQLQNFTIETWIQRSSVSIASFDSGGGEIFGYGSGGYALGMNDNGTLYLTRVDISNVATTNAIVDTDFHHVAVSKSGATVIFYIDGVAYPAPPYNPTFTFGTAAIGARGDTLSNVFLGSIDEVAVYNRALDASEILAIYNAQNSGKCRIPVPPIIASQPTNKTVYIGSNATFIVTAGGDMPLYYQWFFNNTTLLPGKTTATLTLPSVQLTDHGNYSVLVSNAVGFVLSSNAVLTVLPLPDCAPVFTNLVSWWRAENDFTDSWGPNNGTAVGAVSFAQGKAGRAFNFNGSSVRVPDSPSLDLTSAMTIEAWIYPNNLSGARTVAAKYDNGFAFFQTNNSFFFGTINNGQGYFAVTPNGSSINLIRLSSPQFLPTNQWSHLAATYDGLALRLYVNGSLAVQSNYVGGIFSSSADLYIAGTALGAYVGLIDELSIFSRALSASEIAHIYNSDIVGKCLVAPVILAQPQNQVVPLGEDALFSVTVAGNKPLRYQWSFNATNIAGATNSTLLLEKVQTNRVGNYAVIASNSLGIAVSSNATLGLLPPPSCVAPPTNMISWWPVDNFSTDIIGTNGLIFVNVASAVGKVRQAMSFNGINSRANVGFVSAFNLGATNDLSIEGWIKALPPIQTNANMPLVEKRSPNRLTDVGYTLSLYQGHLAFAANTNAFVSQVFISSGPDLRDSMFHHIALSLNRSATNGGNLYVDGQVVLTFNGLATRGVISNSTSLVIGGPAIPTGDAFFNGLIDELSIYGRALSSAEILAIRQAGAAGKCVPPPNIITQPTNRTANVGSPTTFRVVASGYPNLVYQWHKDGTNNVGPNSSIFTIPSVSETNAGVYSATVSNPFGASLSPDAVLIVNHAPTVTNINAATVQDKAFSISIDKMLTFASDADGDSLTLSTVSSFSTNSGSVVRGPSDVTYTPPAGYVGADSFSFTISDGRGGSTVASVIIQIRANNQPSGNMLPLIPISSGYRVSFSAIPGYSYTLQRAESLSGPWITLAVVFVDQTGIGTFDDTSAPPTGAYYRTVYP